MDYIIVYDKKTTGNPIVGVHSQRFESEKVTLNDIHPGEDPKRYGFIVVTEEIVRNMITVKYKTDRKGQTVYEPVAREETRDLTSIKDTSLNTNIVLFEANVAKVVSVKDLNDKTVKATIINAEKGIIDVGKSSGFMTVTCHVQMGEEQPVIESQEVNWKWVKDKKRNITAMKLISKPAN